MPHYEPYSDGLLDKNSYYHAQNIWAFPASNSVDTAKLFTETNTRNITINITDLNYVVSPNPGGYSITLESNKVVIAPGKAIINGFEVLTNETLKFRLPKESEIYRGEKYKHKYKGFALLCLHTTFDALKNLSGNIQVGSEWYFEGIHLCYPSAEIYEANENEYLLLGGVKPDGSEIKPNDEIYSRIDSKYIGIRLEPDPDNGTPPKQSTNLYDFVNNYLHGYWLSKGGDHEYGNLTFRRKPLNYLQPGFNYTDGEEALDNTKYAVKIGRPGLRSALKPSEVDKSNIQSGYINTKMYLTNDDNYERQTSIKPLNIVFKDQLLDKIESDEAVTEKNKNNFSVFLGCINTSKRFNSDVQTIYDQSLYFNNVHINEDSNKVLYDENGTTTNNVFLNRIKFNAGITPETRYIGEFNRNMSDDNKLSKAGSFIWDSENITNETQRFNIEFSNKIFYVGGFCTQTKDNGKHLIQNDLFDIDGNIATSYKFDPTNGNSEAMDIIISSKDNKITFKTHEGSQIGSIGMYSNAKAISEGYNLDNWKNVIRIEDNVEVKDNMWNHGFIVVGDRKDEATSTSQNIDKHSFPKDIKVPDYAHIDPTNNPEGMRNLKPGDIYATQVWTAVYNDIAEIFDFSDNIKGNEIIKLIVAQDTKNPTKYTIADRKLNNNIIGIVSENPGICTGGEGCKNGIPVALAGRVNLKYEGKKLKPGDFVGLSKKTPGFASKCWHFSKYRCGKVLQVFDDNTIEILVLL